MSGWGTHLRANYISPVHTFLDHAEVGSGSLQTSLFSLWGPQGKLRPALVQPVGRAMVFLPQLPEDRQAALTLVCPHLVVSECPLGQGWGQDWDLGGHQ